MLDFIAWESLTPLSLAAENMFPSVDWLRIAERLTLPRTASFDFVCAETIGKERKREVSQSQILLEKKKIRKRRKFSFCESIPVLSLGVLSLSANFTFASPSSSFFTHDSGSMSGVAMSGVKDAMGGIGRARSKLGLSSPSVLGVTSVGTSSLLMPGDIVSYGLFSFSTSNAGLAMDSLKTGVDLNSMLSVQSPESTSRVGDISSVQCRPLPPKLLSGLSMSLMTCSAPRSTSVTAFCASPGRVADPYDHAKSAECVMTLEFP